MKEFQFSPVEELLADIRSGKLIIITDDENRENEGDLVCASDFATPENIAFMARHACGLICAPITQERAQELNLTTPASMTDPFGTAFTQSVDYRHGTTTGISAYDRSKTVMALNDGQSTASDFTQPGHLFPLIARPGGVLRRTGHTEAAVDLARLAGCNPGGVICEIMNPDGTMARLPQLIEFARKHDLKIGSVASLVEYRRHTERLIVRGESAKLPTEFGEFSITAFRTKVDTFEHLALVYGDVKDQENVLVRVHSECLTGDVFASRRCDCGRSPPTVPAFWSICARRAGASVFSTRSTPTSFRMKAATPWKPMNVWGSPMICGNTGSAYRSFWIWVSNLCVC